MADKKKVLLVDDDAEILALLRSLLKSAGHEVVVTTHPSMVLRLVREESPDLIVCDVDMDERTGGEVAADLAADEQGRSIPFLFLSALVKDEEIGADGRVGGLAMISKSAPREAIVARIEALLSSA